MQIQVNFSNLELVSSRIAIDTIKVTFWGTEFFKSKTTDTEVRYGTTLEALAVRQIYPEVSFELSNGFTSTNIFLVITAILLSLLLLCIMGTSRILVSWMLIISLQIITHLTLLSSFMPQEIFFFLKNLLSILRLKSDEEASDPQGLNIQFQQAGYTSSSLEGNISVALTSILIVAVIIIAFGTWVDRILGKPDARCKILRPIFRGTMVIAALTYSFCYFEIVLCCFVSLSSWESEKEISWVALVLTTLPFIMFPIYFMCQFKKLSKGGLSAELPSDTAEKE